MKKIFRNTLLMLAAGALAVSCADYNETNNFTAQPDPSIVEPYKDLAPVKTYLDREQFPNMTLGAQLLAADFNKQELAHAAAITNFDNVAFGTSLMSGKIINARGVMNFLDMSDMLDHVEEIDGEVFGSPLFGNANQADEWLNMLTAPIEIPVDFVEGKTVDYTTMSKFEGTVEGGSASIAKYDGENALKIGALGKVRIIEGFEVDPKAKYTTTFWAKADKDATFEVVFSGNKITGSGPNGKWTFKGGKWNKIVVEAQSAAGETEGYLRFENSRSPVVYIQKVEVGYYPDNHRPQTAQEIIDTIDYAIHAWCDGLMDINKGRISSFDLIDEPIDTKAVLDNGMYDLNHSTEKIFWQDILGSEQYAPVVSRVASAAFEKHGGNPAELRFFISESGLDSQQKFESLMHWIGIWDKNGAKIDGINAKLNLVYSEDATKQAANEATLNRLLDNLVSTGKLVRLSNFDIKYQNANGLAVSTSNISEVQRQQLANYYGAVIKTYLTRVPRDQQAGICKGNLTDTGDPVGLWSVNKDTKDWVRTATYKAFCDALAGK